MLNEVKMVGNIGKVGELKETKDGKKLINFSVAMNRPGKDKDDKQTTWVNLTVWDKQAEGLSKVLSKAKAVLVEGYLYNRPAKDEDSFATTEIGVNRVQIVAWKESKDE